MEKFYFLGEYHFDKNKNYDVILIENEFIYLKNSSEVMKYDSVKEKVIYETLIPEGDSTFNVIIHDDVFYLMGREFTSFDLINGKEIEYDFNADNEPIIFTTICLKNGNIGSSYNDGSLKIWNRNGLVISIENNVDFSFYAMCELSNGVIVAAGYDTGIRFYDQYNGQLIRTIKQDQHQHPTDILVLNSPEEDILISGCNKMIKVWNIEKFELLYTLDFGCELMGFQCFKDLLIFRDKVVNYKTKEILEGLNLNYFDKNGRMVVADNIHEKYLFYSIEFQDKHFKFLFERKMEILKKISFDFQ